jgi:adenine-specific DNA-methyltransferase
VTAFPDRVTFRKFAKDIAWETEVWIADNPDHMIHFNGDKFLGPYTN